MPIQFIKTEYIPPVHRSLKEKTAKEKFEILKKEIEIREGTPLRLFHFHLIEHNSRLLLFNGIGKQLMEVEDSVKGIRLARNFAFDSFMDSQNNKNKNGGYKFN